MRTRIATAVSCFAIALGGASVAQAQSFPSPGNYNVSDSEFVVEQTQQLTCNIDGFDVAVVSGSATIDVNPPNTLLSGDSLCTSVGLDNSNWIITDLGGGSVTVSGISATTLLGTCSGTVNGTFSGSTLTIPRQSIPGDVFGIPVVCYIEGQADI